MRFALATILASCVSAVPWAAEPEESRIKIQLADVHWQPLHSGIDLVCVGPDGRVWYQCSPRLRSDPEVDEIKTHIESEFRRDSPQIHDVQLVLFEPGGRVWFYSRRKKVLLGYDGLEWITRELEEDILVYTNCRCLTRGALIQADGHRFAGGVAWFIAQRGVYHFDGETWSYQRFGQGEPEFIKRVKLSVSSDGRLAVAHVTRTRSFWLFRDGQWSEHQILSDTETPYVTYLVAEDPQTIWYAFHPGKMQRLTIDAKGKLSAAEESAANDSTAFGSYVVAGVQALYQDTTGRILVAAASIDDGDSVMRSGVVIREPDGQTRLFPSGGHPPGRWLHNVLGLPPPILTDDGKQVWLTNRDTGEAPGLFDLERQEFVEMLPDAAFVCLHAVGDGGRLFVARGGFGASGQLIMVYTPGAKESEPLTATPKEIKRGLLTTMTAEGAIWTADAKEQLIRFDDDHWQVIRPQTNDVSIRGILAGGGNVVLVEVGGEWVLYQGADEIGSGPLFELLENYCELLCKAFSPEHFRVPRQATMTLVGNRYGHLWLLQENDLWLFANNRWYDSTDALESAGCRAGKVDYLAPVGDGGTVIVSNLRTASAGNSSFFGKLEEGKLRFTRALHIPYRFGNPRPGIRDLDGAFWLPSTGSGTRRSPVFANPRQWAARIKTDGAIEQLEVSGVARLADRSGNVWLSENNRLTPGKFRIWRDGKVVQELRIPAYENGLIFADRPGSVYAYTASGLQHVVADGPDYREYRLGQLYSISGVVGQPTFQTFSKQGWLVICTYANTPRPKAFLNLVELPEPQGE